MAPVTTLLERFRPLHCCFLGAVLMAGCGQDAPADTAAPAPQPIIILNQTFSVADTTILFNVDAPVAVHCDQDALNAIVDPLERYLEAFDCGDELFADKFNEIDGVGANVGEGKRFTRVPRADLINGTNQWHDHFPPRETGPNSQSCEDCHLVPIGDGAGFIATQAVRDPNRNGILNQFIERSTPHLMGLGAIQRLAEEMTADLQTQLTAARARLVGGVTSTTQPFSSKGIAFGTGTVTATAVSGLTSIDNDLIVKPFQWKGSVAFVRDFVRGAGHNELGMQGEELVGRGVDGDGDGVANEFGIGDITALSAYMATQARPVTKLELNAAGLLDPALTPAEVTQINQGQALFSQIGCGNCHTPSLSLTDPVFQEPSASAAHRDATFPSGVAPISVGVDPANPIRANLITDLPDNMNVPTPSGDTVSFGGLPSNGTGGANVPAFTDLRRHNMGLRLAEHVVEGAGVPGDVWMTRGLWGVGATPPYLHDGRAPSLMSAILEHANNDGSEAQNAVNAVRVLSVAQQRALVAFLDNLILVDAATLVPPAPGGGGGGGGATPTITATLRIQTDWGAGYCTDVVVTNTSTVATSNWSATINIGAATITQSWNTTGGQNALAGRTGNGIVITPIAAWNQVIAPGGVTSAIGFCANRTPPTSGAVATVAGTTAAP